MNNKLINLFLENFKQISNGLYTSLIFHFLNKNEQQVIKNRRNICATCPYMSENYKKLGVYSSNRKDKHCSICKCNIKLKTACLKCNCGIEKYNESNEIPLKLKWEKT
jgi:hypothetical protein